MGGNLLKDLGVDRISAEEMATRIVTFDALMEEFHRQYPMITFAYDFPMPIYGKTSFGDMDVIYYAEDPELLIEYLKNAVDSKGSKKNGQCTSLEWNGLQVDMLYASPKTFSWQLNWYSHGDVSALLGRVYRYYGFKFGHDGLSFNIKTKSSSRDILVTTDWKEGANILDYKPLLNTHMYKQEDVYAYILSSKYAGRFVFEKMKPDRPREMQVSFYEWVMSMETDRPNLKKSHGWKLLYAFDKGLFLKAALTFTKMHLVELYNPVKRRYRKFYYTKVKPFFGIESQGNKNAVRNKKSNSARSKE